MYWINYISKEIIIRHMRNSVRLDSLCFAKFTITRKLFYFRLQNMWVFIIIIIIWYTFSYATLFEGVFQYIFIRIKHIFFWSVIIKKKKEWNFIICTHFLYSSLEQYASNKFQTSTFLKLEEINVILMQQNIICSLLFFKFMFAVRKFNLV